MLLVSLLGRAAGLFIVVVIEDVGVCHLFNVLLLQPVFHGVELLRELAEKLDQSLRLLLYRHLFLLLVVRLIGAVGHVHLHRRLNHMAVGH